MQTPLLLSISDYCYRARVIPPHEEGLPSPCNNNLQCSNRKGVSQLERAAHREFEIMRRLMNSERYSCYGSNEITVDARRIRSEINAEWSVQDRHDHLKLYTCAHAQAGVGARKKLRGKSLDQTRGHDLAFQFGLLQNPGISQVQERN